MKTAISIPDDLFKEVGRFAQTHNCSRSEVFATAARDFLEKIKSMEILDGLNKVYSSEETSEDKQVRNKAKRRFSKKIIRESY